MALPGGSTPYAAGNTGAAWVEDVWTNTIEQAAYDKAQVWPIVDPSPKPMSEVHIRKHAGFTAGTLANTADHSGHTLTFSSNTETEVTKTPTTININVAVNDQQLWQMSVDPMNTLRDSIEMALGAKVDQDLLSLITALTTNIEGDYATDVDKSAILALQSKVEHGAKQHGSSFYLVFHTLQGDHIRSVSEFIRADIRGSGGSPAVSGMIPEAFGLKFIKSGNVQNSGGGYNNGVFVPSFATVGWNKRIGIERQRFGLSNWLIGVGEYIFVTKHDARAGLLKSKNT